MRAAAWTMPPPAANGDEPLALYVSTPSPGAVLDLLGLARTEGYTANLAAGVLKVAGGRPDRFLARAVESLPPAEARAARAFLAPADATPESLFEVALGAEPLGVLETRERHADLLTLFADQGAFYSRYQPIVDLTTCVPIGYEALLRASYNDEEIQPQALFEAAEAVGRVTTLDEIGWVAALLGAAEWLEDAYLFINFLPVHAEYWRRVMSLAAEVGIRTDRLVVELTESHRIEDLDRLLGVLEFCRTHGCLVALDDVGAGYSTLSLVAAIKPDVVKVDRDLIQGLPGETSTAVVVAIATMARHIGARVVAEGIETQTQACAARELGIEWGQGFLLGRPELPSPPVAPLLAMTDARPHDAA